MALVMGAPKGKNGSAVVPPTIQSGFVRKGGSIIFLFSLLTLVYFSCLFWFKDSGSSYLIPAKEYCENNAQQPCTRADLFAFQIASGIAIIYCGLLGAATWHVTRRSQTKLPQTAEGRLYGFLEESDRLAAANFTFQVWDFFISLLIPEHSTPLFLAHHLLAAFVSWSSLHYQYLHYYGVFFLGVTEVSSIFLVFVDLGKYFPPQEGAVLHAIVTIVMQPGFAVSFVAYRVIVWWKVSCLLWKDTFHVLRTGKSEQYRPGKSFVLYFFLVANVLLGALQLYWCSIILGEASKVLKGVNT